MSKVKLQISIAIGGQVFLISVSKLLSILLIMLTLSLTITVKAQYNYTINNGTITITEYTGSGGAVVIPGSINGLPVTGIGEGAFFLCSSLTSVTITNTVTRIGERAFYSCNKLTNITIPNSVTGSIGDSAFYACSSLASVTIGHGITSIGNRAFYSCNSLTNVTIPNNVTSILDEAFRECRYLTNVTMGNGVDSIGSRAFYSCSRLTSVTNGNSLASMGDAAFGECNLLASVYFPGDAPSPGLLVFEGDDAATVYYMSGTKGWSSTFGGRPTVRLASPVPYLYVIDNGRLTITEYTGTNGTIVLPRSIDGLAVTSVGAGAFQSCTSLTNVTIPGSITNIGNNAFNNCSNLTVIYFQGDAPMLGTDAFKGDRNATVYYLPGTAGWGPAFGGCPAMSGQPSMDLMVKTVQVTLHVIPGRKYQVQSSVDWITWTKVGTSFAASSSQVLQEYDATQVGRFFRVSEVP